MANWHGIRSAIATKLALVSGIATATADDIDAAPETPAVLVTNVSNIEVTHRSFTVYQREADINCLLLVARTGGAGAAMQTAEGVLEGIFTASIAGVQLGYPTVVQDATLVRAQMGQVTVAGIDYIGGNLTYHVTVRENVTESA